jgi:hypothetical protein
MGKHTEESDKNSKKNYSVLAGLNTQKQLMQYLKSKFQFYLQNCGSVYVDDKKSDQFHRLVLLGVCVTNFFCIQIWT